MLYAYSKTSTEPYQNSGRVSHFIKTTWNNNVRKFRWAIIGISLAWCVIAVTNASNLDGQSSEIIYLNDDHPIMVANTILN
jgi:uncharacterized membrane protein YdfJ with MMPL/SSD domain